MVTGAHRKIGLFGGTFDPIHNGHLRVALELKQRLSLDEMRLLPCHMPPHRAAPGRSSDERLTMVELAVENCPELQVDDRELRRDSPSWSVDTLRELRAQEGPEVSLCWCIGMDSLANLETWHCWRDLLSFAHLVAVGRPGWHRPTQGELGAWLQRHMAPAESAVHQRPAGHVLLLDNPMLDISATSIRADLAAARSIQFLVPDAVRRYISDNHLYRSDS